jgi:Ca-activated chloride channel family protein
MKKGALIVRALAIAMLFGVASPVCAAPGNGFSSLSVRITSPLGRTGIPGTVRIVAQIQALPGVVLQPVQFFVDGTLLSTVSDGPPYAADWVDANPFDPREIAVSVTDTLGNTARDVIRLKPLEVFDESQVTSVLVDATVQDKAGRFVRDLTRQDFKVFEDGVPQTVDLAARDDMPATFALLVDSSQSMANRIDFVRETANRVTGFMRPKDRMLVVPFSKTLEPITGPTDDRATVSDAIGKITPRGGTAILDALVDLAPHLGHIEGRRAVILVTDGYDEHSNSHFDDAIKALKSVQATVYVVAIGGVAGISLKGERLLKQLALETGGRAFLPSRDTALMAVHDALASDIQNRYLLSYTPSNQDVNGTWRAIAVQTVAAGLTVRARSGYFAPKPPPIRPSIEFTMTDRERQFLDVSADALTVEENGVPQAIETFEEAVAPVSIILALDSSGSMKRAAETAQVAATRFVDALRPEDRLSILMFSDHSQFAHDLGTDRQLSHTAIAAYQPTGGTALYDALTDSLERLKTVEGRRVIIVVTDGRDEDNPGTGPGSKRTFEEALAAAREVDAVVYAIGVGPKVDHEVLVTLADATGGEALFPEDASQLETEYRRVLQNLRRRWIISYTSTDSVRNGAWRSVTIRTKDEEAVVRSRGGYFAPGK